MRSAVVDAAAVSGTYWLSYLFALFYLLVAAGSVTHRDLLLESPVKLPFLNIDLPLVGFFLFGPILFLIVHAHVLLHFALLSAKIGRFNSSVPTELRDLKEREALRWQLPINIFVQFLAGPGAVRKSLIGLLLRFISASTLIVGPLVLLTFFEIQFLAYHDILVTWEQRLVIVADIALLWGLWPTIARGRVTKLGLSEFRRWRVTLATAASIAAVSFVCAIATFPGEWQEENFPSLRLVPGVSGGFEADGSPRPGRFISLHELLFEGSVDLISRRPISLWSNRLIVPGIDVVDHSKYDNADKIAALMETVSLRSRRLEGAVLIGADLRKTDFTGADLRGASLQGADLREAKFGCDSTGWRAIGTGSSVGSQSEHTSQCTNLQGAKLDGAKLQGANLKGAQLQGASVDYGELQTANLDNASLQGSSLVGTDLIGVSLKSADLEGVYGFNTEFEGADLGEANFRAALLPDAQLQGAILTGIDLDAAYLRRPFVWRADMLVRRRGASTALILEPVSGRSAQGGICKIPPGPCDLNYDDPYAPLNMKIIEETPKGKNRDEAMKALSRFDPSLTRPNEDKMAQAWNELAKSAPASDVYNANLAKALMSIGCQPNGAPYVIQGLARHVVGLLAQNDLSQASAVSAAFLDQDKCPGAHGLSDYARSRLQSFVDQAKLAASSLSNAPLSKP